jgi:hypothetical protein
MREGGVAFGRDYLDFQHILQLAKSTFVAPEVCCKLTILRGEPETIFRKVVGFGELFNTNGSDKN